MSVGCGSLMTSWKYVVDDVFRKLFRQIICAHAGRARLATAREAPDAGRSAGHGIGLVYVALRTARLSIVRSAPSTGSPEISALIDVDCAIVIENVVGCLVGRAIDQNRHKETAAAKSFRIKVRSSSGKSQSPSFDQKLSASLELDASPSAS